MPQKGDIALCGHGRLGLITCEQPSHESGTAGNVGAEIWTGVHLIGHGSRPAGSHWQSRQPRVIASVPWLVDIVDKARKWDEEHAETHMETRYVYDWDEDGNGPPRAVQVEVAGPARRR